MKKAALKKYLPALITALFLLFAYSLRFLPVKQPLGTLVRSAIYFVIFLLWGLSVRQRVIHPQARRLLFAVSLLIVFWMAVRTLRFLTPRDTFLAHYCWYLYYIPLLFIPLLTTLIAASLGKPESFRLPAWISWLFVLPAALFLLVLTNDLHQLVFVFSEDTRPFLTDEYQYGAGFLLVAAWSFAGILATLGLLFAKSRLPGRGRRLLAPLVPTALLLLYTVFYALRLLVLFFLLGDMTVTECLLAICILETCLRTGLIQSNTHYAELFRASGIRAVIVDEDYRERISSESYTFLLHDTLRQAEGEPVMLSGSLRLSSAPIRKGRVFWQEDVSEIAGLLEELREVNERLSEDNDLLLAEDEMKQRQARVAEQDRLYDKMAREVLPQLQVLDGILSGETDAPPRETLKLLCVYGAYIKRRCNLLLLGEEVRTCPARELEYCIRESCEALSAAGIDCSFRRSFEGELPIHTAILLYDLLQGMIELLLSSLSAFFLRMTVTDGQAELKLLADCARPLPEDWTGAALLCALGGTWKTAWEDGTLSLALSLPKGGEA